MSEDRVKKVISKFQKFIILSSYKIAGLGCPPLPDKTVSDFLLRSTTVTVAAHSTVVVVVSLNRGPNPDLVLRSGVPPLGRGLSVVPVVGPVTRPRSVSGALSLL